MTEPVLLQDESLRRNVRFLVLEVVKQVDSAAQALLGDEGAEASRLASRDDYIDHLRTLVENKCFGLLRRGEEIDKQTVDLLRSTTTITTNLERIADHAVSAVRQWQRLEPRDFLRSYDVKPFFTAIFRSLELVIDAYEGRDGGKAVEIARGELELDALYEDRFRRILADLSATTEEVPNLVTALFIVHYLERIGDCLQNIGEAVLFAKVGERLKMRAYRELSSQLHPSASEPSLEAVDFRGIWGTRSGSQIGRVRAESLGEEEVIFKEGDPAKIRREKEAMERWAGLVPGLAPRVLRYREGDRSSMLVQYLEGQNLQEIVMNQSLAEVEHAVGRVLDTLARVWRETPVAEAVRPSFIGQLDARLDSVYGVHPYFRDLSQQIGPVHVRGLSELLETRRHLDQELEAPFTILGHGDFNLDNVIFNSRDDSVHFIDLYRSRPMDYVQDVSVFLVSSFRVPDFRPGRRAALNRVIELLLAFAGDFASEEGDATFQARLALGLVRSFVSSTRFEIRRSFAEEMLRRAVYLLERLDGPGRELASFRLPRDVLFYG